MDFSSQEKWQNVSGMGGRINWNIHKQDLQDRQDNISKK
jgi:hypothetical protein